MNRRKEDGANQFALDAMLVNDATLLAMAHELKSPLCLIRQLSLFLEKNELPVAESRHYLDQITLVSERGLRLVSDLSKVSQVDQLGFELEPLSPAEVCRQVAQEIAGFYQLNGCQLKLNVNQRQHYLAMANYGLLKSVLVNFCDNALYYSDQSHPVEMSVSLHKKSQKIRVAVRDRGPKLPKAVWRGLKGRQPIGLQKMSSRPLSSGLGIYLAGRFAAAMSAEIGGVAHSDGATFYIDLNVSKQLSLL